MERPLTGLKDADREILVRIDSDKELLKVCHANKYLFSLCNNDFYRNRMRNKFPNLLSFYPISTDWKKAYLENIYYIGKMEEDYGFKFSKISANLPKVYYDILKKNIILDNISSVLSTSSTSSISSVSPENKTLLINEGFKTAGVNGLFDLADFFISLGANNFIDGLIGAIISQKNLTIIEYFLNKIDPSVLLDVLTTAFQASVGVNNQVAMDYFVSKIDLNEALINAAINKNYKIIYYLISKDANVLEAIRITAERQLPEIALLLEKYYVLYLKLNSLKYKDAKYKNV